MSRSAYILAVNGLLDIAERQKICLLLKVRKLGMSTVWWDK